MPNLLQRLGNLVLPRPRPMSEMGVSGTAVHGGYVRVIEKSPQWVGRQKYTTISELASNVSIVAAGVHHFLNLIAHPNWSVTPVDDTPEALKYAEFVEGVMYDMTTTWSRIVRRSGGFRFYGFGLQEWTAKRREDGQIGIRDIEPRPPWTIEQWQVADDGTVEGAFQRAPQTGQLLGLPRGKLIYLVEDTLTDNPEGMGLFRHLADPYNRLKAFQDLEVRAFERDLRGTPIGRAPLTLLNRMVQEGSMKKVDADKLINDLNSFVKLQVKKSDTGIVLDSMPYENLNADGTAVAGLQQWSLDLLTGTAAGIQEIGQAIDRLQREMARLIGVEHLMLGDAGGNRALSQDKSRNLYLIANGVLSYMGDQYRQDFLGPLWVLNGFPEEMKPYFATEDVTFKDVGEVTAALRDMATAGAVLAPDDPVINDVRELLGVQAADLERAAEEAAAQREITEEMQRAQLEAQQQPATTEVEEELEEEEGARKSQTGFAILKQFLEKEGGQFEIVEEDTE